MEKKIGILSIALAFLNLLALLVNPIRFSFITGYFNLFALDTLEKLTFHIGDFDSFIFINSNYISLALTVSFIAGALIYHNSGYRDFRILRFIYSVLFFKVIVFFPMNLVYMYSYYFGLETTFYSGYDSLMPREFKVLDVLRTIISLAFMGFYVIACYKIIRYFNSKMQLKSETEDYDYYKRTYLFETKKLYRFWHLIADNILLYSIFYTLFRSLIQFRFGDDFLHKLQTALGENGSLLLVTSVFRIVYFVFFEIQFRATPGKFLTQTRVMQYDGAEATTGNIISRTFCRLVPFDSLTFLLGYNLHDNWSSTAVYDEIAIDAENQPDFTKDHS